MPRKRIAFTDQFPYHVMARSNNREWFYISKENLWEIFKTELNRLTTHFEARIHAFVLMDNHYHLLISASANFDLGKIMCILQTSVSRTVNRTTGRINHVFGGPYRGCSIQNDIYYLKVFHYVYRNPIEAGLVEKAENYRFSTFQQDSGIITTKSAGGFQEPISDAKLAEWINQPLENSPRSKITSALRKTIFKLSSQRNY